jgi:hypothetical protein
MKKTIVKPDGTTEVVEGTAEEIAAYERQIKQQGQDENKKQPSQPGRLDEEPQRLSDIPTYWYPVHSPFCEITVAMRGWLSIVPPHCTCGATPRIDLTPYIDWTVYSTNGYTVTTDSVGLWALPKVTFKG